MKLSYLAASLKDLNMAFSSVAILFFLVIIASAQQHEASQTCPSSFTCGSLGTFGYPFTTFFNPNCGICTLNCTEPYPTIRLGRHGPWYDIMKSFSDNKTFLVSDSQLIHAVNENTCDVLNATINLPRSRSISFTILHNQTLWKCPKGYSSDSNSSVRLISYCGYHDIYRDKDPLDGDKPANCSAVLYPDYVVVELSDECSKCVHDGGRCIDLMNEGFKCINNKKGRRKLILQLGIGLGGGIIVLGLLGVIIWHLKKVKLVLPAFGSRNISADPTRTDLGRSKMYFSLPVFPYNELVEATNNFDPTMELGDGGFGTVYYGKLKDGREVAVKRLYERNYRQLEQFMNEIEILTCLRHQNLVSLYGCTSRRSRELLLVYEYIPNGTVADHLHGEQAKFGILTWAIRMSIAIETARALSYLHASDIVHRDVKSNNILLDNNFSVKVADFGLSRLFRADVTHISTAPRGTPGYLDPEYHQCYQLTAKSDVYSFGVVLIELISSMPAIDISRKDDDVNLCNYAMKKIQCCEFGELIDPRLGFETNNKVKKMTISVAELAFQCLQHKKEFRPSMDEVLDALKSIESVDYEVLNIEGKHEKDSLSKTQTEAEHTSLLRNTEEPPSPNSVMHKWGSSKSITPTSSR